MNLIEQYNSGISANKLSKIHNMSITTITNRLKKANIKMRCHDSNNDWSFINKKDDVFFYFLGWGISDGCIYHKFRNGRNRGITYILTVHKNDIHILNFFHDLIKCHNKLATNQNCKQFVSSIPREYADKLSDWGLVQRKTYEFTVTDNLKNMTKKQFMQFLVGFIEGDGNVTPLKISNKWCKNYISPRIRICSGSSLLINFLRDELTKYGHGQRKLESRGSNNYTYSITGKNAINLANDLLKCEYKLLNRKWDIIKKLMQDDIINKNKYKNKLLELKSDRLNKSKNKWANAMKMWANNCTMKEIANFYNIKICTLGQHIMKLRNKHGWFPRRKIKT